MSYSSCQKYTFGDKQPEREAANFLPSSVDFWNVWYFFCVRRFRQCSTRSFDYLLSWKTRQNWRMGSICLRQGKRRIFVLFLQLSLSL